MLPNNQNSAPIMNLSLLATVALAVVEGGRTSPEGAKSDPPSPKRFDIDIRRYVKNPSGTREAKIVEVEDKNDSLRKRQRLTIKLTAEDINDGLTVSAIKRIIKKYNSNMVRTHQAREMTTEQRIARDKNNFSSRVSRAKAKLRLKLETARKIEEEQDAMFRAAIQTTRDCLYDV